MLTCKPPFAPFEQLLKLTILSTTEILWIHEVIESYGEISRQSGSLVSTNDIHGSRIAWS